MRCWCATGVTWRSSPAVQTARRRSPNCFASASCPNRPKRVLSGGVDEATSFVPMARLVEEVGRTNQGTEPRSADPSTNATRKGMMSKFSTRLTIFGACIAVTAGLMASMAGAAAADRRCTATGMSRDGINLTAALIDPTAPVTGEVDATGCNIGVYYAPGTTGSVSGADIQGANYYGVVANAAAVNVTNSSDPRHRRDAAQRRSARGRRLLHDVEPGLEPRRERQRPGRSAATSSRSIRRAGSW